MIFPNVELLVFSLCWVPHGKSLVPHMDLHTKFDFPFVPILARDLYNEAKWQFVLLLDAIFVLQTLKVADIVAKIIQRLKGCVVIEN